MTTPDNLLVHSAEQYVRGLFQQHHQENLVFHNITHVENVVKHVKEIMAHYELQEDEVQALPIAAWFHDTGHLFTEPALHEQRSVELMEAFLKHRTGNEELIKKVASLILMTRPQETPHSVPEMIIRDADTYHFGTDEFKKSNKQVKKEFALRNMTALVMDWERNTLLMLERHQFYTSYCNDRLANGKKKNIERIRKKVNHQTGLNSTDTILIQEPQKNGKLPAQNNGLITKGIQTMLRLTSENHLELSNMADGKASILISVNAIIISVILSVLIRRIEVDTYLTIPTIIFLTSSLSTIIIAILATRPKVSEGNFSREDILNKKTNLLFFGNFHKTRLEEYQWAMNVMMRDPDYLYGSLVKDIYYLGVVLGRKYKLIRLAYTVFMIGIFLSVIAFVLAMVLHQPRQAVVDAPGLSPF